MPEVVAFLLSTARTGTRSLAEGLAGEGILSPHQPPYSRPLNIASNFYLHGWLPYRTLEWLTLRWREPQILRSKCRHYLQVFSLDYFPAYIISKRHENVRIVHIVRDPRTFVTSYMNWMRGRFRSRVANRLVPGWHPSGFFVGEMGWSEWRQMDQFQRVCWHWAYKNRLLEELFAGSGRYYRVRFEALFLSGQLETLREMLSFMGIPFQERFEEILTRRRNSSRKSYFPRWEEWPRGRQKQLLSICRTQMENYGYL